jgi:hypothetical protein
VSAQAIEHVLVVAGLSGSGKSTFVTQLAAGKLSRDIASRLPTGVETWMVLRASNRDHWSPLMGQANEQLVILEYDMANRSMLENPHITPDAEIATLLRDAKELTIINLRPTLEVIVEQLAARKPLANERLRKLQAVLIRWQSELFQTILNVASATPRPIRERIKTILKKRKRSLREQSREVQSDLDAYETLDLKEVRYNQSEWLRRIYAAWDQWIDELAQNGATVNEVYLEPDSDASGSEYAWRIQGFKTAADRVCSSGA